MDACRLLFPGVPVHQGFLRGLDIPRVKSAYRDLAKKYHPDQCGADRDPLVMARLFGQVDDAYKRVTKYLSRAGIKAAATTTSTTWSWQQATSSHRTSATRPVKPARTASDVFYSGPMPTFQLKIGLYLYYRGLVPYSAVVDAMVWQRGMRPPLGELAIAWGWLDARAVSFVRCASEITAPFGERAFQLGLLSRSQVSVLLLQQNLRQQRLGRYFVAKGYFTEYEMRTHLRDLERFNAERTTKKTVA